MRSCHGGKQVGRERRNAALARQVVADKRDLANFGTFFHEAVFHSSRPALLCTRVCAPSANAQMCCLSVKREGAFFSSVDSVLRAVVFKALYSRRCRIVSMSPPSCPSAWLHPCRARCCFTWQNHCTSHRDWGVILEQPAGGGIGAVGVGFLCGYGGHGRSCPGREKNALDSARSCPQREAREVSIPARLQRPHLVH